MRRGNRRRACRAAAPVQTGLRPVKAGRGDGGGNIPSLRQLAFYHGFQPRPSRINGPPKILRISVPPLPAVAAASRSLTAGAATRPWSDTPVRQR